MTGDEKTNDESKKSEDISKPIAPPMKAVFSDDFDDPDKSRDMDELPDDEPLTPELVEEEAIRGDFMLRWATVLLAILMAFGQLNDTKPLVLIRSGELMRANGFLPSSVDQMSFTLEGNADENVSADPVPNVSWMFDHVVSMAWSAAGEKGLTFLKVIIAGLAAYLLTRISIPGVSSWWSSICAAFAVVASSSDYIPIPELMTILGMTLTMRLLFLQRLGKGEGLTWKLPLLIAVWCNFDPRAWVGAGVVVAYAVGANISGRIEARRKNTLVVEGATTLMVPAILSVLALLINPFPVNSLLGPLTTYNIEYPAMQAQRSLDTLAAKVSFDSRVDYFSVLNPAAVVLFDHSQIAGLALLLMAMVVLVLSRSLRDSGFLAALIFMTGLVVLAAHELPAAAIVAAVVASVSAQDWYRRSFNMKYSTESSELLFSRGGRAATVLALALVGFCVVASRLPGAMPLGFGFEPETKVTMDTFKEQLSDLDPEARILHTRIEQGDLLIWNGRKSFVDSRMLPFGRPGDKNSVFGKHTNILKSLFQPTPLPKTSDPNEKKSLESERDQSIADAKSAINEFKVTHAMTRLAFPGKPDYVSMQNLASSGEWIPISIGASAAILERLTATTSEAAILSRIPNFPKLAFQVSDPKLTPTRQFATPLNFYEKYVYRTRPVSKADKRIATHYLQMANPKPESMPQALASLSLATLAVRHLNASLALTPDSAESYELLGQAYGRIGILEQMLAGASAIDRLKQIRYFQSVIAFRQALVIDPSLLNSWEGLLLEYQQMNKLDLASEALNKWLELVEENPPRTDAEFEEFVNQRYLQKREFDEQLELRDKQISDAVSQQTEAMKAQEAAAKAAAPLDEKAKSLEEAQTEEAKAVILTAVVSNSAGCPRKALQALQENIDVVRANPISSLLLNQFLLEVGELDEAHQGLALLSQEALKQPTAFSGIEWQLPTVISQLSICEYSAALQTWTSQMRLVDQQMSSSQLYSGSLFSLPMVADVNFAVNETIPVWPFRNSMAVSEQAQSFNESRAELTLLMAIAKLEEGDTKGARPLLETILADFGETRPRMLATIYYSMMNDKAEEFLSQHAANTWEEFQYPGEKEPVAATAPAGTQQRQPVQTGDGSPSGGAATPGSRAPGAIPLR